MRVVDTALPGVKLLEPVRHGDGRGWFSETWNQARFAEAGIAADFVQDNHVRSAARGVLRGLHFQIPPRAQAKLLRVVAGAVWDVVVDIRHGARTFGRWIGVEISASSGRQIYVPPGFAHGYLTLEVDTEVLYKVDDYWAPAQERGLRWNDSDVAVDWPMPIDEITLSDRDAGLPALAGIPDYFRADG